MEQVAAWAAVISAVAGGVSAFIAVVSARKSRKDANNARKAREAAERTADELGALVKQVQPPVLDYDVVPNGDMGEHVTLSTRRPDPVVITAVDEEARISDFLVKQPGDQVDRLPITVRQGSPVTVTIFRRQRMSTYIPIRIEGLSDPFYLHLPRRPERRMLR